jgi:hypothetical protein
MSTTLAVTKLSFPTPSRRARNETVVIPLATDPSHQDAFRFHPFVRCSCRARAVLMAGDAAPRHQLDQTLGVLLDLDPIGRRIFVAHQRRTRPRPKQTAADANYETKDTARIQSREKVPTAPMITAWSATVLPRAGRYAS